MFQDFDPLFWATAIGAAFVRVFSAETVHWPRSLVTFLTAIFCAWLFTDACLHYLGISADVYEYPVAAVIAITAENLMRIFLIITSDLKGIASIIRAWRGK